MKKELREPDVNTWGVMWESSKICRHRMWLGTCLPSGARLYALDDEDLILWSLRASGTEWIALVVITCLSLFAFMLP